MATTYPFQLSQKLLEHLPPPASDGRCYIDVRVRGSWDGILVVDSKGFCVGIHVRRRIEEFPLPFDATSIEAVRPACLWNRILARIPFDPYAMSLFTVFITSPALLALSAVCFPPLSVISIISCLLAIYFMYNQGSGFPLIRPFAALFALMQVVFGVGVLARWLLA